MSNARGRLWYMKKLGFKLQKTTILELRLCILTVSRCLMHGVYQDGNIRCGKKVGDKMRKTILVLTLLAWYQYKKSNLLNITSKFNVSDYNEACQFYTRKSLHFVLSHHNLWAKIICIFNAGWQLIVHIHSSSLDHLWV